MSRTASLLPGVLLALLPKCPMCLAAWFAIATGISVSAVIASWAHTGIVLFCTAALLLRCGTAIKTRLFPAASENDRRPRCSRSPRHTPTGHTC